MGKSWEAARGCDGERWGEGNIFLGFVNMLKTCLERKARSTLGNSSIIRFSVLSLEVVDLTSTTVVIHPPSPPSCGRRHAGSCGWAGGGGRARGLGEEGDPEIDGLRAESKHVVPLQCELFKQRRRGPTDGQRGRGDRWGFQVSRF